VADLVESTLCGMSMLLSLSFDVFISLLSTALASASLSAAAASSLRHSLSVRACGLFFSLGHLLISPIHSLSWRLIDNRLRRHQRFSVQQRDVSLAVLKISCVAARIHRASSDFRSFPWLVLSILRLASTFFLFIHSTVFLRRLAKLQHA
jgi:hypothetical protein